MRRHTPVITCMNLVRIRPVRVFAAKHILWKYNRVSLTMSSEEEVKNVWRSADCVCFDVDSTICIDEAIDELAAYLEVGDKVAALTNQAMGGSMTFKESFRARLNLMKASRQQITQFLTDHPPKLTENAREVVDLLQQRRVPVYLITGGFQSYAETVADALDVPRQNIFANKLTFYYNGQFAGFDENQLTCETGGKPKVIQKLKDKYNFKNLVHVGDGATDMEACPPADAFIGFGGNQVREKVKAGSKWFVMSFQEMLDELRRKNPRLY